MNQRNIIIAAEDFNHRRRQRRPADKRSFKMRQANIRFTQRGKQTGPDDRNAEGDADLLFAQQPQQAVAVQIRPRQNQASARHRGNKGVPQALTWNIGTTGSSVSCADIPAASG